MNYNSSRKRTRDGNISHKVSQSLKDRLRTKKEKKLEEERKAKLRKLQQSAKHAKISAEAEENANVEDDLDKFFKQSEEEAKKKTEAALERENQEQDILRKGGSLGDLPPLSSANSGKHKNRSNKLRHLSNANRKCYVCKKFGHTKADCPDKKCRWCYKKDHVQVDCPEFKKELEIRSEQAKIENNKRFFEEKKKRRKQERLQAMREKTGVWGYKNLYRVLQLPENKLATKTDIKKAYQRLVLIWHPDKHSTRSKEDQELAESKYEEIRNAHDLLLEGLENGNLEGQVVASAGVLANIERDILSLNRSR
eukprot:augustus_masked-scaffold_1-processed-gene-30.7-mRNA-1 protein AED:1.00 eAED:1.00 QI:0/-1/0/0/-1/1/1/0/308